MRNTNLSQLNISYLGFEKRIQQELELYLSESLKLPAKPASNNVSNEPCLLPANFHIYFFKGFCNITEQMIEKSKSVNARILCVSQFNDFENLLSCVQTGAYGFISITNMFDEIIPAIMSALQNKIYVSSAFAPVIHKYFRNHNDCYSNLFTDKENKLVHLLTKGALYKEIAWKMHISENTVRSHVRNIYGKMKVHSKTELTRKILNISLNLYMFIHFKTYSMFMLLAGTIS